MGEGIPQVVLNSGKKIPVVGLGTATAPLTDDFLKSALVTAMEVGYSHFDTASLYGTETALGKAIVEALERGIVNSREDLFITSKLWPTDAHRDRVLPALKQTLQKLELEYIDLYLIHWPMSSKPSEEKKLPCNKEDLLPLDYNGVWEAMEECQSLGLAKSIGVSNFSCKKLSHLLSIAKIPPAVNQVEMNVAWQQRKLRDFCKEQGILLSAWSPLGGYGAPWGWTTVMESPILKEIATSKGKTVPQVALRWLYQQGVCIIVKSFNKERMKENLQIFDWELSEDDLHQISQIPQCRGTSAEFLISADGPFKTLQDLWDEES